MQAARDSEAVLTPDLIRSRLRDQFGVPERPRARPPLDELVLTILSQNTNDRNRDRAFDAMKTRFPNWREVLESSPEELEAVIAPAGLGRTKSRRIWAILEEVNSGTLDVDGLCDLSREMALELLTGLKGVGPKTAAWVLLFSCRMPAFPVDTHVFRVCGRLGLLAPGTDRVKAHAVLEEYFDDRDFLEIHLNIIRLGRQICRARSPACGLCTLSDVCPASMPGEG